METQGAVINISSVAAIMPTHANFSAYGVAKAAQDKLTQDLAFEFAPKGVRVNSILPGKSQSLSAFIFEFEIGARLMRLWRHASLFGAYNSLHKLAECCLNAIQIGQNS